MTKHKKTYWKYDKLQKHKCYSIQKDKIEKWHNTKKPKTKLTKNNQLLLRQKKKNNKMQKDIIQIWENSIRHINMWQNTKQQITDMTMTMTKDND